MELVDVYINADDGVIVKMHPCAIWYKLSYVLLGFTAENMDNDESEQW